MVCPVCASGTFKVISNKKLGEKVDIRRVQCADCGQIFLQELKLTDICINGQFINLDTAGKRGKISELGDAYVEAKIRSVRNAKL